LITIITSLLFHYKQNNVSKKEKEEASLAIEAEKLVSSERVQSGRVATTRNSKVITMNRVVVVVKQQVPFLNTNCSIFSDSIL
jgi:hypothetical protein